MDIELNVGDHIVFLLDREELVAEDLVDTGDVELQRMANEWLQGSTDRFFVTVARKWQPVPDSELNTFASHDDALLFADKASLLVAMPHLAKENLGNLWLILAAPKVERAVRKAMR